MKRINTATVAQNLFGAGKNGFTAGNQQGGVPPTQLSAEWHNGVQENLCRFIEATETLDSHGDLDLAYAVRRNVHLRKPMTGVTTLPNWSSFQAHADADIPGTWKFFETTLTAVHRADDSTVVLGHVLNSDVPNNSRMWIDVHALCINDADVDMFHMVVLRSSAKRQGGTVQDFNTTTLNTDNDGGLTVVWSLVNLNGGVAVVAEIPVALLQFFNLFAHVQVRCVTIGS